MANEGRRGPEPADTVSATARYIATLSGELAQLARRHRLDALAYILEMARQEADQAAKSSLDKASVDKAAADCGAGLPG